MAMHERIHCQHCLNYIRQSVLCKAADSLEPGDFMTRDYNDGTDKYVGDLACQDWTKVFDMAYQNTVDYKSWTAKWN